MSDIDQQWADELERRRRRHDRLVKDHGLSDKQAVDAGIRGDRSETRK